MTIDKDTKLLDVLAEEFEYHGKTVDRDIRGFKEINGLKINISRVRDTSPRQGLSARQGLQQTSNRDEDSYRGSLSSIKTMSV
jgi:hypothetical protein